LKNYEGHYVPSDELELEPKRDTNGGQKSISRPSEVGEHCGFPVP